MGCGHIRLHSSQYTQNTRKGVNKLEEGRCFDFPEECVIEIQVCILSWYLLIQSRDLVFKQPHVSQQPWYYNI